MSTADSASNPTPGAGEQLGEKLGEIRETLHEMGQILRHLAEEKVEKLKGSGGECCAGVRAQCDEMCHGVEECIRTQPMKSVLVAAGIGAILGPSVCDGNLHDLPPARR